MFALGKLSSVSRIKKVGTYHHDKGGPNIDPTDLVGSAKMGRVNRHHSHLGALFCWLVEHLRSLTV